MDKSTSDASRMYFLPSAPAGTDPEHLIIFYSEGKPFDVNSLQMEASPIVQMPDQCLTVDMVNDTADKAKRKRPDFANLLKKMLSGEALGTTGERHGTLLNLTWNMVTAWPHASAESIVELLAPSLRRMAAEDPNSRDWTDEVSRMVTSAQQKREEDRISTEHEAADKQRKAIERVIPGRTTPYTPQELAAWNVDPHRWILQYGSHYYFFINGEYVKRSVTKDELVNFARDALAPAFSAGVDLMRMTKEGFTPKTLGEITREYGSVVTDLELSIIAQQSTFDGKTLTIATCPRRPIEPKYSEKADVFLKKLGGPKYEPLLDWIASLIRQEVGCCALFLKGPQGAGKSFLAEALSMAWTDTGPVKLTTALDDGWNEDLMRCPLIFGDEQLPKDLRGRSKMAEFRAFVTERNHRLSRRYRDNASVRGYFRVILAANNEDMFRTIEALTADDIDAISTRVLTIFVSDEPKAHMEALSHDERTALFAAIAPHALYLAETRQVVRGSRFIVDGDREVAHAMAVSAGLRGPVLHWLASYLRAPQALDSLLQQKGEAKAIRIVDGQLLVTARAMAQHWEEYTTNCRAPELRQLSEALKGISLKGRANRRMPGRKQEYWSIDIDILKRWASENWDRTPEEIDAALAKPTPDAWIVSKPGTAPGLAAVPPRTS